MSGVTLCNLASGSSGNCSFLATESTRVLIDAGISARRIKVHLQELGVELDQLDGICVTHEHSDHIQALPILNQKHGIPLYSNAGTIQSLAHKSKFESLNWKIFSNGQPFEIGDMHFQPFSIPQDAYDPVSFVVTVQGYRIGFATDIGLATRLIRHELKGCHVLVLETNHDRILLDESDRPWSLKQRISGRQGHLSNEEAADLLREIAGPELQQIFLAHMSQDCNQVALAESCIRLTLKDLQLEPVKICMTYPKQPSEKWWAAHPLDVSLL
ncbi:MAG: MBL fold metallo-hydrolase [Kiritimatiellae bacterium]|jgi:phosphoribosyl 1,2-cyclic phosphodiesterase|nr:MBL fold metallo-hydrolase [Kiritimatiellia bacterium]